MAWMPRAGRSLSAFWLALAAGATVPVAALAQAQPATRTTAVDPASITGHDFGGIRFSQDVIRGPLSFAGTKVWSWQQGSCHRLVVEGEVRVNAAAYEFVAKRCVAWIEPVEVNGKKVQQVFIYFEDLGSGADPAGTLSMNSKQLPVRGMIEVQGAIGLTADLLTQGAPAAGTQTALIVKAEEALAKALRREVGITEPSVQQAPVPKLSRKSPYVRASRKQGTAATIAPTSTDAGTPIPPAVVPLVAQQAGNQPAPSSQSSGPPTDQAPPVSPAPIVPLLAVPGGDAPAAQPNKDVIFAKDGIVTISPGEVSIVSGEKENTVIATGGVTVQYLDRSSGRVLTMTAQRAAVFLDPGKLTDALRHGSDSVRGIFLEGGVMASDGEHTVRAPEVYYDFKANKAVMLDAVFWTYDERRKLPLYVRAKSIRQESARQWVAKGAKFTNTAFFDPELALGASSVTITREEVPVNVDPTDLLPGDPRPPATETRTKVQASHLTVQAMGLPVFYWPYYSGDPSSFPIKDFRVENSSGSGGGVGATFNAYSLLGLARPKDTTADLIADYYFERGAGLGTRLSWAEPNSKGGLFAYMLPSDTGTDTVKPSSHIEHDGEFRGMITGEERWRINDTWTLFAEGTSISDVNFVTAFFPQQAENARELTNRVLARHIDDNTYLSLQVKGTFDDFISNEYLLTSQGYSVQKLPEALYVRQADDLLDEHPGLLTYTSEYRAGYLAMAFDETVARDRGFRSNTQAQRAFGINANQSIADSLEAQGLFEDGVTRLDTRHELSMQTTVGPVTVMPFAVGRLTFWDDGFDQFSPENNDQSRLWSAAGVRLSTTLQRVYEGVDSSLFDIRRLRHVIEPNATFWIAGTSMEAGDLPVYDSDVEALTDGGMMRLGVTQTFQTQRGGPGRWHNVDLLTLTTDFVYSSDDATRKNPIPRFFDYRPELSNAGTFFVVDATMRLTDAASLVGGTIYDFDLHQQAVNDIGLLVRHSPGFISFADLRYVNAQDSTYLVLGTSYDLTDKYSAAVGVTYDATHGGFQSTAFEVRRRFASMLMGVSASHSEISGETSFGFVFQPFGASTRATLSGVGSNDSSTSAWR